MTNDTPDVLKKIIEYKRTEIDAARLAVPAEELRARILDLEDSPRGFERHLREAAVSGWTAVIAEVKKGSPSKGIIRDDFDPLEIAGIYQENGATCLSVLTDERFFMGHLRFLHLIRESVSLPLLRKDFIIDPYQIHEARAAGADAILLIASCLELTQLKDFHALARELHLDVLLEVHDETEMEMANETGCSLVGVNNRNLRTFVTDLGTTGRLAGMMPAGGLLVAESGITCRRDIEALTAAGAGAFLIGESLMREKDIGKKLRELINA
ncbi:indole-3-glycerol phosphate synthase TrpC [Geobacter sp. SVR]|uniref:indole-3-glycerol phosphate synthase TrpC n=1 Tax=Geobacter sp. SVR TaxID=2495594 RepID=UPI00143EFEAA|nr:indole-3-glycerol phosphate synthase TrpC [Geobacter sp. SVR]BCS53094.1 indole-3-glycerol-phosphate synthase [Geobacter sp. SVR]GCF84479.1 indole-3-glycerol-phosphate synthase [Geobacter sp. SVR]